MTMAIPPGLETLEFVLKDGQPVPPFTAVLVGVVGSGNLEVLLEPDTGNSCTVRIETSARGFSPIWTAVVHDFHARHQRIGLRVLVNDMGATPAVVSLRLDQAMAEMQAGTP